MYEQKLVYFIKFLHFFCFVFDGNFMLYFMLNSSVILVLSNSQNFTPETNFLKIVAQECQTFPSVES